MENSNNHDSHGKLADMLLDNFESFINKRRKFFHENNFVPDCDTVSHIINRYSNENAVISGASSLIPGPLGMIAALPEIYRTTQNQIYMIYDIGFNLGLDAVITKEFVAGILLSATSHNCVEIVAVKGSEVIVKKVSTAAFKKLIKILGIRISQRAASSMAARWLPVVGSVALSAWSRHTTKHLGKKAIELFSKDIIIEDVIEEELAENQDITSSLSTEKTNLDYLRLQALINLLKSGKSIDSREIDLINELIRYARLSREEIASLKSKFTGPELFDIDFPAFNGSHEDSIGLITDLVAFARIDDKVDIHENAYLNKVACELNIAHEDLLEMINIHRLEKDVSEL